MKYMDAVHDDAERLNALFADPRVMNLPGGGFQYPSDLFPPDLDPHTLHLKHIGLLVDGRSYQELADQIREAYRGLRVNLDIKP
jgi:hypothetical protein